MLWRRLLTALCSCVQEAEGGALASFTGTMRYSSGLIADQKRTAAALVRVSKMMGKVRLPLAESSVRAPCQLADAPLCAVCGMSCA